MSQLGQNAKYSSRVDVFRFASKLRRSWMRSALRICAKTRLWHGPIVHFGRADIRGQQTQGAFSTENGPYAARFSCMIGVRQQGQFDDEEF
jgi:hypothetical protein